MGCSLHVSFLIGRFVPQRGCGAAVVADYIQQPVSNMSASQPFHVGLSCKCDEVCR